MTSIDPFNGYPSARQGAFDNLYYVAPSDTQEIETIPSMLIALGSKTGESTFIKVTTVGGQICTFEVAGNYRLELPVRVRKVWATGTTVADIVALF